MKTSSKMTSEGPSPQLHSFEPIYDEGCRVLILGTMASPASLKAGMYYGHPQNAFWRILSELTGDRLPVTNCEKRDFLLRNHIALWDTLRACDREGALDSAIRREEPNEIAALLRRAPGIKAVFLNGSAAARFYQKYHAALITLPSFKLPSTSPANARGGFEAKLNGWRVLQTYL